MINLSVVKKSNRNVVYCGLEAIISYSIVITNDGTKKATGVKLIDELDKGQHLMKDTVVLNGEKQNITSLETAINIGEISPGGNSILSFGVSVEKGEIINYVGNKATVSYLDEEGNIIEINSDNIPIAAVDLNISIDKDVDENMANVGEIIPYIITISNEGNDELNQVRIYNSLPEALKLVPGTITVNSIQKDTELTGGVVVETLPTSSSVIIKFNTQVISTPLLGLLQNKVYSYYKYTHSIDGIPYTSIGEICTSPNNYKCN